MPKQINRKLLDGPDEESILMVSTLGRHRPKPAVTAPNAEIDELLGVGNENDENSNNTEIRPHFQRSSARSFDQSRMKEKWNQMKEAVTQKNDTISDLSFKLAKAREKLVKVTAQKNELEEKLHEYEIQQERYFFNCFTEWEDFNVNPSEFRCIPLLKRPYTRAYNEHQRLIRRQQESVQAHVQDPWSSFMSGMQSDDAGDGEEGAEGDVERSGSLVDVNMGGHDVQADVVNDNFANNDGDDDNVDGGRRRARAGVDLERNMAASDVNMRNNVIIVHARPGSDDGNDSLIFNVNAGHLNNTSNDDHHNDVRDPQTLEFDYNNDPDLISDNELAKVFDAIDHQACNSGMNVE